MMMIKMMIMAIIITTTIYSNQQKIVMIKIKKLGSIFNSILRTSYALSTKDKNILSDIPQSAEYKPIQKVINFIKQRKMGFQQSQSYLKIQNCLFCKNQKTSYSLVVDKKDGKYLCKNCKAKGSWDQFRAKTLNLNQNISKRLIQDVFKVTNEQYQVFIKNIDNPQYAQVLQYLKSRGFNKQTIQKYQVGAGKQSFITQMGNYEEIKTIYFPMFKIIAKDPEKPTQYIPVQISKIKVRGASDNNKKYTRQIPSNSESGFFGLNTIKQSDETIVITQGQFDAMAVYQQTGFSAISLPQGASNLPDQLIKILNKFKKIILWMDNDLAGQLGAEKISKKIGLSKTYLVKHDFKDLKDANDFLKSQPQKMKQLLQASKTQMDESVIKYKNLKQMVQQRIEKYQKFTGVQIDNWLPYFNKKVKGIRPKQLTIVSGPTGCGKTTFLSQISLDLCKKKIPVLWGSFQVRNQVLITNMLIQYSKVNLFKNQLPYDHYSSEFSKLPLHWMSFHGSNDVDKVLATIQYSIQKHNIYFVILDTLQFLLSGQADGSKKFDLQDRVMGRLRKMATDYNVHIAVVIHPRKTDHKQDIQIHSIYGTSKAAQQADNIWMIQAREKYRIFDIKKNRFDGQIGKVGLGYNRQLRQFTQLTRTQLQLLRDGKVSMPDIVKNRKKQLEGDQELEQFNLRIDQQLQNDKHEDLMSTKRKKKFY